jgi:transposase
MTNAQSQANTEGLFVAIEVSERRWRLAFSDLSEERQVEVEAWDQKEFRRQLRKARKHFSQGDSVRVRSCYEAGRVGFSLHRFLEGEGIENVVVDPASIEVSRRAKHRKTDRLDVRKLLSMLKRYWVYDEKRCWQVCRVPSVEQEAARRLDREWGRLKKERTAHVTRVKALLALHGVRGKFSVSSLNTAALRDWSGAVLEAPWREEFERERSRLKQVDEQLAALKRQMEQSLASPEAEWERVAARLHELRAIGVVGATALSRQFFAWRRFRNRREVGAAAGLTGAPFNSGDSQVDQGITKAGHSRIRSLAVELAWGWLRHQPTSALSVWFTQRFASGGKRMRRIGIVALARKLLVALWKYLEFGVVPEGALLRRDEPARKAIRRKGDATSRKIRALVAEREKKEAVEMPA